MAKEPQPSNAISIEVEGAPLPPGVETALVRAVVDADRHAPDLFVLTFREPG